MQLQTTENHQHAQPPSTIVLMSVVVAGVVVQQATGHQCQAVFFDYYYDISEAIFKVKILCYMIWRNLMIQQTQLLWFTGQIKLYITNTFIKL